jgi:predicted HTH domain antitoxin
MSELTIQLPAGVEPQEATLALSVRLFQTGRLTLGQAATMAGYSKEAYIELLSRQGIDVIDYPADDLAGEMRDEP